MELDLPSPRLGKILESWNPDLCIYAPGPGELFENTDSKVVKDGLETWEFLLAWLAKSLPTCRVIFLSSAAAYGPSTVNVLTEEHPLSPRSAYGRFKQNCEIIAVRYRTDFGLDIRIVRLFNVYGPGQRRQLLWDLCRKAQDSHDGTVELAGDGSQVRDFVHVVDVVRAVRLLADLDRGDPCVWNVGSGTPTTVAEVAEAVLRRWPQPRSLRFTPSLRAPQTPSACADIARLRSLGYEPRWRIDRGIQDYVDWYLSAHPVEQVPP